MNVVVIVEGTSDKAAVETLAMCLGRDLAAEGVVVEAIGGAHAVGPYLRRLPADAPVVLAGLVDEAEAPMFVRALERAGVVRGLDVSSLEALGFFICSSDLEDELIRSLGAQRVEMVVEEQGELRPFRSFQKQRAQRSKSLEAQLHRFIGTHSGRKAAYAAALVRAGAPDRAPPPLMRLLDYISRQGRASSIST